MTSVEEEYVENLIQRMNELSRLLRQANAMLPRYRECVQEERAEEALGLVDYPIIDGKKDANLLELTNAVAMAELQLAEQIELKANLERELSETEEKIERLLGDSRQNATDQAQKQRDHEEKLAIIAHETACKNQLAAEAAERASAQQFDDLVRGLRDND